MGKLKQCDKGFNCGYGCINKRLKCRRNIDEQGRKLLETFAQHLARQAKLLAVPATLAELGTLTEQWEQERGYEEPNYAAFAGGGATNEQIKGFFALHDASHPLTYLALGKAQREVQSMYGAEPKPAGDKSPTVAEEVIVRAHDMAALGEAPAIASANIKELANELAKDTKDAKAMEWAKIADFEAIYAQAQLMPSAIRDIMRKNLIDRLYKFDGSNWQFSPPNALPANRADYFSGMYKQGA